MGSDKGAMGGTLVRVQLTNGKVWTGGIDGVVAVPAYHFPSFVRFPDSFDWPTYIPDTIIAGLAISIWHVAYTKCRRPLSCSPRREIPSSSQ